MTISSKSRRPRLQNISWHPTTHAGLWLDRFLEYQTRVPDENGKELEQNDNIKAARSALMLNAAKTKAPDGYEDTAQTRLDAALTTTPGLCRSFRLYKTTTRMVIGLGQKGVTETGIRLEHTWGVPCIPGSSLKGLAAAVAHTLVSDPSWHKLGETSADTKGESHAELFGVTDKRGKVTFNDGWFLPQYSQRAERQMLAHDIMTVHHPTYYQDGTAPPDGTDSPNPVAFLSVPPGVTFAIVLEAEKQHNEWLNAAWALLDKGLMELGVGGKTNAGYGRLAYQKGKTEELWEQKRKAEEQQRAMRKFEGGTLQDQLHVILETGTDGLYHALREVTPGTTIASDFQATLPDWLTQQYTLREADADEFIVSLREAIQNEPNWHQVLTKGKTPEGWHFAAGTQKLKDLGVKILGKSEQTNPSDEPKQKTSTFTDEEQKMLDLIQPKGEAFNSDAANNAFEYAMRSGSAEFCKELANWPGVGKKRKKGKDLKQQSKKLRKRAKTIENESK